MAKTATFTLMHITVAFTIVYLMTGDLMVGGAVALVEPLINSVAYFFHERVWERRRNSVRAKLPVVPA
ncbi:MAG: DUF2061 domain-containing protein [Steroidobacter sp.]